jgi:hypothetical protein
MLSLQILMNINDHTGFCHIIMYLDWENNVKMGLALVILEFKSQRWKKTPFLEIIHSCNSVFCFVINVLLCD